MEKGDYKRTHVYQSIDYDKPKYLFECLLTHIQQKKQIFPGMQLLDVGGASGALAYYLKKSLEGVDITILEYDKELVSIGQKNIPQCRFMAGDANHMDGVDDNSFDIVTMVGTLSIFDDFKPSLSECLRVAKKGGLVFIVGQFNIDPVDVLVRYCYSGQDKWNQGYNLFSHTTISHYLSQQEKVKKYSFLPFELPFDLKKNEDVIRTWTEKDLNGKRHLMNGLNMKINIEFLIIEL